MPDPVIELVGKNDAYRLVVDGVELARPLMNYSTGQAAAWQLELDLRRARDQAQRPCICCGKGFLSSHRHNRLCPSCAAMA